MYVPWGKREDIALVTGISTHSDRDDLKDIIRIESNNAFLTHEEILLIQLIRSSFHIPIHRICQLLLPRPIVHRYEKNSYLDAHPSTWERTKEASMHYEHIPNRQDIHDRIQELIKDNNCLIIVPHAFMIETLVEFL